MTAIDLVRDGGAAGAVRVAFDSQEAAILSDVADQFVRLVRDTPDDRAAAQLFPAGYEDPASQAEFSRYTHGDLSERKIAAAELVRDLLVGPESDGVIVELDADDAWSWLTFFTDIRLVLAERLKHSDVESEEHAMQQGLYDWTAYLQGSIVDALSELLSQQPEDI